MPSSESTDSKILQDSTEYIVVGYIAGVFGVKGWVKIHSETVPNTNILTYSPWFMSDCAYDKNSQKPIKWNEIKLDTGKRHSKGIVAKLVDYDEREVAQTLQGRQIAIKREQLQPAEEGEYYWTDLIGCQVVSIQGVVLGIVKSLLETGANDVLVIEGEGEGEELLIPYIVGQSVISVDLNLHQIEVDWDTSENEE